MLRHVLREVTRVEVNSLLVVRHAYLEIHVRVPYAKHHVQSDADPYTFPNAEPIERMPSKRIAVDVADCIEDVAAGVLHAQNAS